MPRKEIRVFADYMEYKIKLNEKKGHWANRSHEKNLELLIGEVKELKDEIEKSPEQRNHLEIMLEAADVANYAMMLGWNCLLEATAEDRPKPIQTVVTNGGSDGVEGIEAYNPKKEPLLHNQMEERVDEELWEKSYKDRDEPRKKKILLPTKSDEQKSMDKLRKEHDSSV